MKVIQRVWTKNYGMSSMVAVSRTLIESSTENQFQMQSDLKKEKRLCQNLLCYILAHEIFDYTAERWKVRATR